MKILYYTSAVSGTGRLVFGISIGNALRRNGISCEYSILSSSPYGHLAGDIPHREIPIESEEQLSPGNWEKSHLYNALREINPDILLVNHCWFTLYHFMDQLPCKKIYLSDQVIDAFFKIPLPGGDMVFNPRQYDQAFRIEPFNCPFEMELINPLIIRNRDEIFSREEALQRLGLKDKPPVAFYGFTGNPGDHERHWKKYSYLKEEGYQLISSTSYQGGLFPIADYYNAFDLMICGAGYNQFWEVIYFDKEAVFEVSPMHFSKQYRRVRECQEYTFSENGADRLVRVITREI